MDSVEIYDELQLFNKALSEYTGLIRDSTNDRIGLVGDILSEKLVEIIQKIDTKTQCE